MDTDELDQWLEADDTGDDGAGRADGWANQPPDRSPRKHGRPRWLWPALAALTVWLAVMAVTYTAGDQDGADTAATPRASDLMVLPDPVPDAMAGDDSAQGLSDATPLAAGTLPATAPADQHQNGRDDMAAATTDPPGQAAQVPDDIGLLHGAAVTALRGVLTTSSADQQSYLELATPVSVTSLGEGAVIVVLDAMWLEGTEGRLSIAHQGRWAVPLAGDATLLGIPWSAGAATTATAVPEDPPVGTLRLDEVEAAMSAAGWLQVQALAAQGHPFIPEVLVALIDGTPPSGRGRGGVVVWLQDSAEGLVLLGASR